jgi:hypothetical protein
MFNVRNKTILSFGLFAAVVDLCPQQPWVNIEGGRVPWWLEPCMPLSGISLRVVYTYVANVCNIWHWRLFGDTIDKHGDDGVPMYQYLGALIAA